MSETSLYPDSVSVLFGNLEITSTPRPPGRFQAGPCIQIKVNGKPLVVRSFDLHIAVDDVVSATIVFLPEHAEGG